MSILDCFFKTKTEDRSVMDIPEQTGPIHTVSGTKNAINFLNKFAKELETIKLMDDLLSRPMLTPNKDMIRITNHTISWIPDKKLCVLFNLDGDPLCAYFEDNKE